MKIKIPCPECKKMTFVTKKDLIEVQDQICWTLHFIEHPDNSYNRKKCVGSETLACLFQPETSVFEIDPVSARMLLK